MAKAQICPDCGNGMRAGARRVPTIDHVIPKALGGTRDDGNKPLVCRVCNEDKGSLAPDEWRCRPVGAPQDAGARPPVRVVHVTAEGRRAAGIVDARAAEA